MKLLARLLFTLTILGSHSTWAFNKFYCQCKAQGPGFEETNRSTGGIDKICSYDCECIAWEEVTKKNGEKSAMNAVPGIKLHILNQPTSAYSYEDWDAGSHICHGQWSYRPHLSDPNWMIKVKFDSFGINSDGDVIYPEDAAREVSQGVRLVGFRHSKKAKEISAALLDQLSKMK